MRKALDACKDDTVLPDSVIELAECLLKNNISKHSTSFYKHIRETAIETKIATYVGTHTYFLTPQYNLVMSVLLSLGW